MKTLGQIAYEAYGFDAQWKTYNNKPMPPWFDLGDAVRAHWEAAAQAIAAQVHAEYTPVEETYGTSPEERAEEPRNSRRQRKTTDTE